MTFGQYMEKPRDVCLNHDKKSTCKYLQIKKLKAINGKYFRVWYCTCEDEMCAGCIPTFDEG